MKGTLSLNSNNSNSSNEFSRSYSSTHITQIIPSSITSLPNGRSKRLRQKDNYTDILKERSNYQSIDIINPLSQKRGKSESNRYNNNEFSLKNSTDSLRKSFDYNKIANHSASPKYKKNNYNVNNNNINTKGEMQLSELNSNNSNYDSPYKKNNNINNIKLNNLNKSNFKNGISNNSNRREFDKNGIPLCNSSTNIFSKSSNNFSNYSNNYQKNNDSQKMLNKSSSYKGSTSSKHKKSKSLSYNRYNDDNNSNTNTLNNSKVRSNSYLNKEKKQYIGIDMGMISNSSHPNNEHFNTQIHTFNNNNNMGKIKSFIDNDTKDSFIEQSDTIRLNDHNNMNYSNEKNYNPNNTIKDKNYKISNENSKIISPLTEQSNNNNTNTNNNNNIKDYNYINKYNNNSNTNNSKFLDGLNQSSIQKNISRQEDKSSNIDISLSYKYQQNNNNSVNISLRNGHSLSLNDLSTNRNDSNYSQNNFTYQIENISSIQRNINSNRPNLILNHMEKIRENPLNENLSSESLDENYKSKIKNENNNNNNLYGLNYNYDEYDKNTYEKNIINNKKDEDNKNNYNNYNNIIPHSKMNKMSMYECEGSSSNEYNFVNNDPRKQYSRFTDIYSGGNTSNDNNYNLIKNQTISGEKILDSLNENEILNGKNNSIVNSNSISRDNIYHHNHSKYYNNNNNDYNINNNMYVNRKETPEEKRLLEKIKQNHEIEKMNSPINNNNIIPSIRKNETIDINSNTNRNYIKNNNNNHNDYNNYNPNKYNNNYIEPPLSKSEELLKKERLENMQQVLYEIRNSNNDIYEENENLSLNDSRKNILNLNSEERQKQENRLKEFDKIINEEKNEHLKKQKSLEEIK